MIPVIMAGGSGTRLWPLSRTAFPKQFLALNSQLTLLQETAARLDGLSDAAPLIICNEEHRFLVAEQLRQQGKTASIILEPVGRNTAPAIALAAFQAVKEWQAKGSEQEAPVLLILAADHVIKNTVAFQAAVSQLLPAVQAGKVGTLGIVPTEAATGYGYIRADNEQNGLYAVEQFVEKPDAATAQRYLDEGAALSGEHGSRQWYWNSGMFMIRADRYLEELARFSPAMFAACELAMADTQQDLDFIRINKEAFEQCPDDSIDYAIMEPLCALESAEPQVVVAPLDAGWSDVGSWSALWEIADKCENGNAVLHSGAGEAKTILKDTRNSLISTQQRMITTLGVDDLIIVDTLDAVLVAHKDKVQDIKSIVAQIKAQGGTEHHQHREVYRPWGVYDSIDNGERYQVKRISVKPGAKLSVQMHHHRAEHWIVVSGTASVTNGDETYLVTENESTFIPIGQVHALENPGKVMLEMIEVQSGSYLGEDDIVRFEDRYGRVK
ncbi:mannose-1-phosphate guanylyltransferase/mannose-6-phosphate isomerase [Thalassolituus oleivorans]|uniref:mannose-1-phosphate guanylyltransferase n=2 Tax=Thalassolituus oleivorans TaxID=187493 RepID=M5DSQ9_9GAMM|nr:mannose-1-phosphate guanylyltransferase/mannose-6-phosphate isomerase [Thalassolituus oleivorans]CCU72951.1 mannose-1-phosphate guanylyltransferase [Thalassolituus oleivorans MIL-1]